MDNFDDFDELTPEELEQERRRKAAAKRRRMEAREQRRKKRRREAFIRCSILAAAVILVFVGIIKMISGISHRMKDKKEDKNTQEMTSTKETTQEDVIADIDEDILAKELPATRDDALAIIQGYSETDTEYKDIFDNAAVFSDDLLRYVAVNPEMKRFVIDYIAKISIVFEGNFTLTTPVEDVPLYLQFDEQWGYADYGESVIAIKGAGPTCLSMVYTYIKQEGSQNPIKIGDMAMNYGYLTEEGNTANVLFTDGAANLGLKSTETEVKKKAMINALNDGKLIICAVNQGDFTPTSSYIVIKGYKQGLFLINDPLSEARSQVGWDFPRLSSQIAKMWVIEDGGEPVAPTPTGEPEGGTTPDDGSTPQGDGSATGDGSTPQGDGSADTQAQ